MSQSPIGELLRNFRLASGFSQEALSEASGVSVRTISDLERGARSGTHPETARLLAEALELSEADRKQFLESASSSRRADQEGPAPEPTGRPIATRRGILPLPPTPLIGREDAVAKVLSMVEEHSGRIVTLTGPGGVGKTRLAIEAAHKAAPSFGDDVAFVELAPVSDPDLVGPAIARALGLPETGAPVGDQLATFLRRRSFLLVLDNFEHIVAAAPLVAELTAYCPEIRVLMTSRVRLRISAELEYPVRPLDLPDARDTPETLRKSAAIRLFVERTEPIDRGIALTSENVAMIAEVCRRVDGLPLAIELAASRLRVLPLPTLLERLDERLSLLSRGNRDSPQRQHSMRGSIAWSYDLLQPTEQRFLRWLSVFIGGFSLKAVEVFGDTQGMDHAQVLEILTTLTDRCLVQRDLSWDRDPRYTMLETIKAFGREQLEAEREADAARMFHALHFLDMANRRASLQPWNNSESHDGYRERDALLPDQANVLQAFDTLWESDRRQLCLEFAAAAGLYWDEHNQFHEGWKRLSQARQIASDETSTLKLAVWIASSSIAGYAGAPEMGSALAREAIGMASELGDSLAMAHGRQELAWNEEMQEHWEVALPLLEQNLAFWTAHEDSFMQGATLMLLGGHAYARGDLATAKEMEEQAADHFAKVGRFEWEAGSRWYLGLIAAAAGDLAQAAEHYFQSIDTWITSGSRVNWHKPLIGLADVAAMLGQFELTARLIGAADRFMEDMSARLFPFDKPGYEHANYAARTALGDQAFASAHHQGWSARPDHWLDLAGKVARLARDTKP